MGALVSLVMSDIVESTRRWAADEAAMAADLEQHDRVLRVALESAGGTVCKHTGDGMLAMFDDPAAAIDAAAAAQRAMATSTWRHAEGLHVRVAVHAGLVHRRDNDLFGTAVNRVARLLALCPPGAVLVSGVVAGMLAERALEALALRRVGAVTLAGFAAQEDVHALAGPGLVAVEKLVAGAAGARGGRLPAVDESLVGRAEDLAEIWDALSQARLTTLAGVGGMGKTRLALEVAAGAAESYADGAWWIDLSAATSAEAALPVAMAAVEAREMPGRTKLQAFTDRFAELAGLVVFDNCEHVLPAAREMVEALRAASPEMRILATSREALGLRGERILPVGALPAEDALRLFTERARAVRPDLDIAANRETIARLCARLDGIPLAIELAAARCRSMSPAEIDRRLDDRFRLLRGGRSGAERHRTLQAAVAWSYSLLDAEEQHVFDRMAVFAGGTLLDGLAAVVDRDEIDALDVLDRLIARSMVVATDTPLGTRYGQLETLRHFAEDRLVESGSFDAARLRHLDWVVALTAALNGARGLDAEAAASARFSAEVDNIRVAIDFALATERRESAYDIGAAINLLAYGRLNWDLLDQVRPERLDHAPSQAALACELRATIMDTHRGKTDPRARIRSHADLPAWFAAASLANKLRFLVHQLLSGGDVAVIGDLLDSFSPETDAERIAVAAARLNHGWAVQLITRMAPAQIEALHALGTAAVALARQKGSVRSLAHLLWAFSYAMTAERPQDASILAQESSALAERIGHVYMRDAARRAIVFARFGHGASAAELSELRAEIATFLARKHHLMAVSFAGAAYAAIARSDPDACLRLWAVRRRVFGIDRRRELETAGLALPEDLDALAGRFAEMTVPEAVTGVLDALDRVIASGSGGPGPGG